MGEPPSLANLWPVRLHSRGLNFWLCTVFIILLLDCLLPQERPASRLLASFDGGFNSMSSRESRPMCSPTGPAGPASNRRTCLSSDPQPIRMSKSLLLQSSGKCRTKYLRLSVSWTLSDSDGGSPPGCRIFDGVDFFQNLNASADRDHDSSIATQAGLNIG